MLKNVENLKFNGLVDGKLYRKPWFLLVFTSHEI